MTKHITGPIAVQNSVDVKLVIPTILVMFGYAIFLGYKGLPESTKLNQLRTDLKTLQASPVSWNEVDKLKEREAQVKNEKVAIDGSLDAARKEAQRLATGVRTSGLPTMAVLGSVTTILEKNGLIASSVQRFQGNARPRLFGSHDKSVKELQTSIQAIDRRPQNTNVLLPEALPPGMTPQEFLEARQAGNGGGNVTGVLPKLVLTEIEAVGSFRGLLKVIDEIESQCGESTVVGVDLRRETGANGQSYLQTNIVLNLQPAPSMTPASPKPVPSATPPALLASGAINLESP